jgi:hypothetical protein
MHKWTSKELAFLEKKIAGRSYAELTKLLNERFGISLSEGQVISMARYHKLCNGIKHFYPGHPPYYRGTNKTSYKPGQKPWNYIPIGAERVNGDGVVVVKIAATPPKKWKSKHLIIWEKAHGPVPKGHFVIFADGNKRNFNLSNLLMVSYKEIAVMNHLGLISADKDLTKEGKLIADVKLLISDRKRGIKKSRKSQRQKKL